MPFVTPLALAGLIFIPAVIAMYLLKLRREETVVPSTLLWSRLSADVEANAPWQRLRRSLLLLLQLLLVLLLVLLAARPFVERPAGLAHDIVLVMDTSASMGATDVAPDRLGAARVAAMNALADLPTGGHVSVIAVDRSARIVVNDTSDLGRVRKALDDLRPAAARGDLGDALELASKLARRSGDAQVLVATDAALASIPTTKVGAPVKVLQVGRDRRNQAIVALAVRTSPSTVTRSVFISVANLDIERADRRIEVYGDDHLIEARDITLDAQSRADVVIDDVPADVRVVEVRLVGRDAGATVAPDLLASDDRAWAVLPPVETRLVLVVGAGDPYLETALSYLPNVELYGVTPEQYGPQSERKDGRSWDLVIFESAVPATLPNAPILAIAPPRTSDLGQVLGSLTNPAIGSLAPDEPILRYVDLSTTHISQAEELATPAWARVIIPGPKGAPLLYSGLRAGLPTAVLAFEPRHSDLPLQVAFPILLANLTGALLGGSAAPTDAVVPGSPVALTIPAGSPGLTVTRPDGTTTHLVATATGSSVTFSGTDQVGVYTVTPDARTGGSPDPGASGGASASPIASPASSGSPNPGASGSANPGASGLASARPSHALVDPFAPVKFAVDLFDAGESTIAPGSAAAIEALGTSATASAAPGAIAATDARPTARNELWIPLILIVLVALCVEWAVYHRDALIRVRRAVGARFGRQPSSGGG